MPPVNEGYPQLVFSPGIKIARGEAIKRFGCKMAVERTAGGIYDPRNVADTLS